MEAASVWMPADASVGVQASVLDESVDLRTPSGVLAPAVSAEKLGWTAKVG